MQLIRAAHKPQTATIQLKDTVTGTIYADPVFFSEDGCGCGSVTFTPGARTFWHTHERGQILFVTAGEGLVCSDGETPRRLRVGDVVHIPGGEKHW